MRSKPLGTLWVRWPLPVSQGPIRVPTTFQRVLENSNASCVGHVHEGPPTTSHVTHEREVVREVEPPVSETTTTRTTRRL